MSLERLRADYLAKFPARIEELSQALASWQEGDAEGLELVRRIAHRLRGSGASYGFPAISESAAALEDAPESDVPERAAAFIEVLCAPEPVGEQVLLTISGDRKLSTAIRSRVASPGRRFMTASSAQEGLELIAQAPPALIVLELVLSDMDGRVLLPQLRATPGLEEIPLIVVATRGNSLLREECFALGADQYFDRACDLSLLSLTIDAALRKQLRAASTTQMRIMSRLLSKRAFCDIYERRTRRGVRGSLLLLELGALPEDDGDAVLHRVSGLLLKQIRVGDQLARWGPSQLVLLASEALLGGATALLQRLSAVTEESEFRADGRAFRVTLQGGVALLERGAPSLTKAIARAERNLAAEQERLGFLAGTREAVGTQTVMLAEDDEEFAALVRYVLEQAGLTVEHLPTGKGVIDQALKSRVALFLLDGKLPDIDGFDLLQGIRNSPLLRETPVALLTARGEERDVVRGFDLGADDYIVKPCSPKELLARVLRLLRRRPGQDRKLVSGAIAGQFAGDQLSELLQMLGSNTKSGRLAVWGDHSNGQIDLHEGLVVNALASSGRTGPEAAHELLLSPSGRFEYDPTEPAVEDRVLRLGVGALLMEVMRRRDEATRL